ncbi:myb-like protein X isoform X2 [Halyomorpha halys]|nr:enolase-phosphatase E1 [Halyomorpha halys]
MDRMYDSTESGYDGGSQENILDEPHYESIKNINIKSEIEKEHIYEKMNGKKEKENKESPNQKTDDKEKNQSEKIYDERKTSLNGNAKFSDGNDSEYDPKEENISDYDCNKVTIHAVIEAMHEEHMAEPAMDRDSIDSAESNEKSENDSSKSETTYAKSEDHYSKEELYSKLEEVYSRSEQKYKQIEKAKKDFNSKQISKDNNKIENEDNQTTNKEEIYSNIDASLKGTKKLEQSEIEETKGESPIVQKLVKVAEDEGVSSKTPTPPPRNCNVLLGNNDEQTFVEEEYSYEPELKRSSSKLVLRTRSLLNLDEDRFRTERNIVRPSAVRMKITTGPDGTFVIDGRKASSELNLSDESNSETAPKDRRLISGEELRKRKEEIFKPKTTAEQNNKYTEEIDTSACRTTKEEAIYNLKKYLKENNIGLKELLTNNNVVIIDTYRDKKSTEDLSEYNHKNMRECRITGTTTKGEARESNTLPRASKVHQPSVQRHYFYKLVKSRPKLPDEELPDPDKVRSTRQMFQKPKNGTQTGIMLPIAAKLSNPRKEPRPTPEVRVVQGDRNSKGWTDSGSLSSGVSSDMSQLDNMSDKCYTSDEDDVPETREADQHPVSPEVMKKIRACGTTITYYGGRVISHSHGSGNQMTMTIMDEIRQGMEGGRGKFRLVKSNSCGSRLELAGTDEQQLYHELSHSRFYEDMYGGKNLSDEMKGNLGPVEEEKREESLKYEEFKERKTEEVKKEVQKIEKGEIINDQKPSWRELIESRKQLRAMEHNRRPCSDMVFEEYQVLEA